MAPDETAEPQNAPPGDPDPNSREHDPDAPAPDPVTAANSTPDDEQAAAELEFGPGHEFFSKWHRDRYLEDCEREVKGAEARLAELRDSGGDTAALEAAAEQQKKNALAEIKRLSTTGKGRSKRPAGAAKQSRGRS